MRDLLRLLKLMAPHRAWILLGLVLSLVTVLANVGLLALSSWFITSMAIAGASGAIVDYTLASAGVRALALGRTGGRYLERLVNHDITFKLLSALRVWFYERLEPIAPAGLQTLHSGDLLSRIRSDVDTLDDFYVRAFVPSVVAFLATILVTLFLFGYSPLLALTELALLGAGGFLLPLLLRRAGGRPGNEAVEIASSLRAALIDEVRGMAELAAFDSLDSHREHLLAMSAQLIERQRKLNVIDAAADSGLVGASGLALWLGAIVLVPLVAAGRVAAADLPMLSMFLLGSFETIMPLPSVFGRLGEMAESARRLFQIIDAKPRIIGSLDDGFPDQTSVTKAFSRQGVKSSRRRKAGPARPAATPTGGGPAESPPAELSPPEPAALPAAAARLRVEGLRFRYAPSERWVIDGLSFDLRRGERMALLGPTGSGKSSLVNVLLRFWEYEGGRIELCERELRDYSPDAARRYFSLAPQAAYLFHATIRENLLLGEGRLIGADAPTASSIRARAGGDAEEGSPEHSACRPPAGRRLEAAVRAAALEDFIAELPQGMDTIVGESGMRLSAGQARRLNVARALLKEAPFLILDEPTEGLDDATAARMLRSVVELCEGRGLLVISHRKRDLFCVDRVVQTS